MELREDIAKLEEMIASIKKQPEPVKEDKYVEGSRMYKRGTSAPRILFSCRVR